MHRARQPRRVLAAAHPARASARGASGRCCVVLLRCSTRASPTRPTGLHVLRAVFRDRRRRVLPVLRCSRSSRCSRVLGAADRPLRRAAAAALPRAAPRVGRARRAWPAASTPGTRSARSLGALLGGYAAARSGSTSHHVYRDRGRRARARRGARSPCALAPRARCAASRSLAVAGRSPRSRCCPPGTRAALVRPLPPARARSPITLSRGPTRSSPRAPARRAASSTTTIRPRTVTVIEIARARAVARAASSCNGKSDGNTDRRLPDDGARRRCCPRCSPTRRERAS